MRWLGAGVVTALATAWASLATLRRRGQGPQRVTLPLPSAEGVTFHGDVILVNDPGGLVALSARCPHLGCRINRNEGGQLVCPCHGSRFDLTGSRATGPATSNLRRLVVSRASQSDQVDVDLSG